MRGSVVVAPAWAGVVVVASSALGGAPEVNFRDSAWRVSGSSFFDPDTSIAGNEVFDDADVTFGVGPGVPVLSGEGGTSSGPILAGFSWNVQRVQQPLAGRGAASGFTSAVIDLEFSRYARAMSAPDAEGSASVGLTLEGAGIVFAVGDPALSDEPVPFFYDDAFGNTTLSVAPGEAGEILGDGTLRPGVYRVTFDEIRVTEADDPIGDGATVTSVPVVDVEIRVLPSGGAGGLVLGGCVLASARRRR